LKDLIRKHRIIWRRINKRKGISKKEIFSEGTRKEIWREYALITSGRGVIIGRSPRFGLPVGSIDNVCYLVGGSGYGGISYEYDVCFVSQEYNGRQKIYNRLCMVWTLWEGAIIRVDVSDNS